MTPDEMIAVIRAKVDAQAIQYRFNGSKDPWEEWTDHTGCRTFNFDRFEYRVKPTKGTVMTPEQQIEVIQARAKGLEIECRPLPRSIDDAYDQWGLSVKDFNFADNVYRVKPVKKPDVLVAVKAELNEKTKEVWLYSKQNHLPTKANLELCFDGDTGELLQAVVK